VDQPVDGLLKQALLEKYGPDYQAAIKMVLRQKTDLSALKELAELSPAARKLAIANHKLLNSTYPLAISAHLSKIGQHAM
jgi:hypothetical protein